MTIDTGASVTIARPDLTAGQPERETPTKCNLKINNCKKMQRIKHM
jgi:hypothetical protein